LRSCSENWRNFGAKGLNAAIAMAYQMKVIVNVLVTGWLRC